MDWSLSHGVGAAIAAVPAAMIALGVWSCAEQGEPGEGPGHGVGAPHQHETPPEAAHANVRTPEAVRAEHEELHRELAAAIASGGDTGEAAREVERVLNPHFLKEEQYAMPPLGVLPRVARGEVSEDMRPVVEMTRTLEREYGQMLSEHREIRAAVEKLKGAAEREGKAPQAAFAARLMLHARQEEEVLYPAALLVGRVLREKLPQSP